MIVFDLVCTSGHRFEAWFRSSEDFAYQKNDHDIGCPICGDTAVKKAIMAPNVSMKGNQTSSSSSQETPFFDEQVEEVFHVGMASLPKELQTELDTVLAKVQNHVEKNCEYVGDDFAEEARKIFYGESEDRGIYGEASEDESNELLEEGIDVYPLPLLRKPGPTDA